MNEDKQVIYYIFLSFSAAVLLLIVIFFRLYTSSSIANHDKLFVEIVFIASCIFGVSIAIYPGWFKKILITKGDNINRKQFSITWRKREGHHPNCEQFQNHIIKIRNKTLCAGCFGLSIGSIISIFLMTIYIIDSINLFSIFSSFLISIGLLIIGMVYVEILLPERQVIVHILLNVFLVISFFLITVSILELTGNLIYGLMCVLLSFLWLDTRIQLSNWRHNIICNGCSETCKM